MVECLRDPDDHAGLDRSRTSRAASTARRSASRSASSPRSSRSTSRPWCRLVPALRGRAAATRSCSSREQVPLSQSAFEILDEWACRRRREPGPRRARRRSRASGPPGHRRRLVRRLGPGRRYVYGARPDRQARAVAGRGQELHGRHARCRDGQACEVSSSRSCCAGERCLAGTVVVAVGEAHEGTAGLVDHAKTITVGTARTRHHDGPGDHARHRERVLGYIEKGLAEGAALVLDGRGVSRSAEPGRQRPDRLRRRHARDDDRQGGDLRPGADRS